MNKLWRAFAVAILVPAHATAATPADPPAPDGPEGFRARVGGFVQADAVLANQRSQDELDSSTGGPLNQTRFLIRRARVRLDVERSFVWGGLELDANTVEGMKAGLTEADVGAVWRSRLGDQDASARATLGLFRIPFGREVAEADPARFFLERTTMSRALFPGTIDIGARAEAGYGPLQLALAVMNGNPLGDTLLPARDPNAAKDVIGRIGVETSRNGSLGFKFGFSAVDGTGLHPGTPATKDRLVWHDSNENGQVETSELSDLAGTGSTPSQNFHRFALGSDLQVRVGLPVIGAFTLSGELVWAKNLDRGIQPADPISSGRDLREAGYYLGVTQEITRYFMIGVRYDRYNPDLDGAEQRGIKLVPIDGSYSTLALAVAFRYAPGRLILEYDDNDNALGRSPTGLPITLESNQLALRGEVILLMRRAFALSALVAATACGESAPSKSGLDAMMRAEGAQYYPGPMPAPNGGPAVVSLSFSSNSIRPGEEGHPVKGALEPQATSALIGFVGDAGYWVVTAGAPDVAAPDYPTFEALLEFSPLLRPGKYRFRAQAGDAKGRFGEPNTQILSAIPQNLPSGTLVVELSWDTDADLDLHVVTPDKVEVFARNPNSVEPPPPGRPVDPNAWKMGGLLDVDSNGQCVIDGHRKEHVTWTVPPPSGTYTVRVDTFSLCGVATARWNVTVFLEEQVIGRAQGQSGPTDAEGAHDRGAGVLALTFDVP